MHKFSRRFSEDVRCWKALNPATELFITNQQLCIRCAAYFYDRGISLNSSLRIIKLKKWNWKKKSVHFSQPSPKPKVSRNNNGNRYVDYTTTSLFLYKLFRIGALYNII